MSCGLPQVALQSLAPTGGLSPSNRQEQSTVRIERAESPSNRQEQSPDQAERAESPSSNVRQQLSGQTTSSTAKHQSKRHQTSVQRKRNRSHVSDSQPDDLESEDDLRRTEELEAIRTYREIQKLRRMDIPIIAKRKRGLDGTGLELPADSKMISSARDAVRPPFHDYRKLQQEHGLMALVDAAYADAYKTNHPFFSDQRDTALSEPEGWRILGIHVLASCPVEILTSVLDGSLARRVEYPDHTDTVDKRLKWYFDANIQDLDVRPWATRKFNEFAPCIYVGVFVDEHGSAPSPFQWREIITACRQYMSGDPEHYEHAVNIDNQTSERSNIMTIRDGFHRHFDSSVRRVMQLLTFCFALERYLDLNAPVNSMQEHRPMKYPHKYVGLSKTAEDRHKTCNWLSALITDVAKSLFRDEDGQPIFATRVYNICYLTSSIESRWSEEFFAEALSSYFHTGLGFNTLLAGFNVTGRFSRVKEPEETTEMWEGCIAFRKSSPHYLRQLKKEVEKNVAKYQDLVKE